MNKLEERRRLFRLYANDLGLYLRKYPGGFACPICGDGFANEAAIETATLHADLAHVYPSVYPNKRPMTLCCCECNSRIGTKYESQVAQDYKFYNALSGLGDGKIKARAFFDGGSIGGTVSRRGNQFHIEHVPKQTNQKEREKLIEDAKAGKEISFRFEVKAPDNSRHSVALLHSAYLCLFRFFGYEYFFLGNTEWIRKTLQQTTAPDDCGYLSIDIPIGETDLDARKVMFIPTVAKISSGYKCLAVPLPSPHKNLWGRAVLLPGFGDNALQEYSKIRENVEQKETIQFRAHFSDPDTRLGKPEQKGFGRWVWKSLCEQLDEQT